MVRRYYYYENRNSSYYKDIYVKYYKDWQKWNNNTIDAMSMVFKKLLVGRDDKDLYNIIISIL